MEALGQVKAAVDAGLLEAGDYDRVKVWFTRMWQVKAGIEAGVLAPEDLGAVRRTFLASLGVHDGVTGGGGVDRGVGHDGLLLGVEGSSETMSPLPDPFHMLGSRLEQLLGAGAQQPRSLECGGGGMVAGGEDEVAEESKGGGGGGSNGDGDEGREGGSGGERGGAGETAKVAGAAVAVVVDVSLAPAPDPSPTPPVVAQVSGVVSKVGQAPAAAATPFQPSAATPAFPVVAAARSTPQHIDTSQPLKLSAAGTGLSGIGVADECLRAFTDLKRKRAVKYAIFQAGATGLGPGGRLNRN